MCACDWNYTCNACKRLELVPLDYDEERILLGDLEYLDRLFPFLADYEDKAGRIHGW
jgi:hypothetical protein